MNFKLPKKSEFMRTLGKTKAINKETSELSIVYDFSFEHHLNAPKRATGEHYFYHIHRAVMRLLLVFILLGIWNYKIVMILLLHDVIEDAKKAGFDPELVREKIEARFTAEIAFGTMQITKQGKEHSHDMLARLVKAFYIWSLIAKVFDREDNLSTLYGMELHSQVRKLQETEKYFVFIFNRLEVEIEIRVECGALPPQWRKLVPLLRERQEKLVEENWNRIFDFSAMQ